MKLVTMGALMGGLMLGACATTSGGGAPQAAETIRYETSPCFGACPVYAVTVSSDGSGRFEGKRFTAVTGGRTFAVTPQQFADFKRRLQPYRPADGERRIAAGNADCGQVITDQPGAAVTWSGGDAPPATLSLYYGCTAPELAAMKQALHAAPEALPIGGFVAKH
ncbi:MAG TPA: DUF6438 domain-containing protein [Sphingomonas sp.]|nr:DUF6438 domain-containing protein [Sphingomonas sp.]